MPEMSDPIRRDQPAPESWGVRLRGMGGFFLVGVAGGGGAFLLATVLHLLLKAYVASFATLGRGGSIALIVGLSSMMALAISVMKGETTGRTERLIAFLGGYAAATLFITFLLLAS